MSGKVHRLQGQQARAVDPRDSVWLSASAGTGKTQVLSARVLRLLLRPDVRPEHLLCLTFTKAGAAEMAERVNAVLARWVRLPDTELSADLIALGADNHPDALKRARTLFASVLDCPGGGLRIDTIHAFSQWLLAAFPEEAGLLPGTQPMEDRDRDLLAHRVLADLLLEWERDGQNGPLSALEMLSERMGPDEARAWLMRCAQARDAWFGPGGWQEPMDTRVRQLLGLAADAGAADLAALCTDEGFDVASLRRCMDVLAGWGTKTGQAGAEAITAWLALAPAERVSALRSFSGTLFNAGDGAPKSLSNLEKRDPDYGSYIGRVAQCMQAVQDLKAKIDLAAMLTPALSVGRRFALAWDAAKTREGLIDFDDLIRRAAELLAKPGLGEWIRYKLDRQFDHLLVDEAQDTNEAQWSIIDALTGDFFTGFGTHEDRLRTIFVVGDYKQAIFRFQGTSPENFAAAKSRFAKALTERAEGARELELPLEARGLVDLGLDRSYRTAQPVLDFVDAAIEAIGPASFGLSEDPGRHIGDMRPGLVGLWPPVDAGGEEDETAEGPENWISQPEREMADRIARQVRAWLDNGFPLVKGQERSAGPGDVMVLVRKRRDLAGLIVARLHARGVPVAGVDRLRLGAPLAVKDLMASLRFAAQPLDDLSLAALLVSPLIGWSQDQLLLHGYRPRGRRLWDQLRTSDHPDVQALRLLLDPLLARADYEPVQALLHWLLIGPWQGRRQLVARLGREANDPIDELLNAAHAYASAHTPSLQGFIQWFDAGEGELKREPGSSPDLVRVMTVHGSKGLQAPIVILADAAGNPDTSPTRGLTLPDGERSIPLPNLRKTEKIGPIREQEERVAREERQEHWRLLYVAMTRAEEALFIGGALGARDRGMPAPDSWYARLAPLVAGEAMPDPIWGESRLSGVAADALAGHVAPLQASLPLLPAWALRPIGPEPRPPRPLAPSSAGEDQGSDPPLPPEVAEKAAKRGVLMHRLLERLPDIAETDRAVAGERWLARNGAEFSPAERSEMLTLARDVLAHPEWRDLFGPAALAEVPLAATVDGRVIAGSADRLLVLPDRVLVVDFKTARRPPRDLAQVPAHTLRQMGAYAVALQAIYPGRRIEAALLYTQLPLLIALPADVLAAHKPGLSDYQQSFGALGVASPPV
ncbi:double-strand break repair helicase AddA [Altererythrobacter xixiisoli]|uniref:DNA 3'-5' helicase n=1 Tax=Croceibacterium xixiisoli TaxID=1476466 RepID=A0A6I4TZH6_9SPHN|nr:double-strand break repair helicase AddA [Croceibacterium xixiisoli]MXO99763.1 double-strand break repair helicase AddA [Croceibacterium xixiisoli]